VSWSSPQPNVPGRGIVASYGARFWALVAIVGVGAGLGGAALIELLHGVQHVAWGYDTGPFLEGVEHTRAARRVIVLVVGGLVAGAGALAITRWAAGAGDVQDALWLRGARLPLVSSLARAVHSIVLVALGASLGREGAPQQAGAAIASSLGQRTELPQWQRRLLVACGAGAGFAAVYNVPLGGALFALEVLLGTITLPLVLPALATSLIATAVAWIALPNSPTYSVPGYSIHATQVVWALVIGPLAGLAAVAYVRLIELASAHRPSSAHMRVLAPLAVFAALGAVAISYPQILGNGKNVVQLAAVAGIGIQTVAVVLALKPLATAACLASGTPGGLFTPTLAFGVLLGALLGHGWSELWPGAPSGSYAIVGGAAVLGAAMQGPLAAVVLVLELTHGSYSMIVPILLAVVEATVVARVIGVPSIYSARLSLRGAGPVVHEEAGDDGLAAADAPSDLLPHSWPMP
jgi:chloride channel protein, CIC family